MGVARIAPDRTAPGPAPEHTAPAPDRTAPDSAPDRTAPGRPPQRLGTVYVLFPDGIDDPRRPSGGNIYDRRMCDGLARIGWSVHERPVPGRWPNPDPAARAALACVLRRLPDRACVLVDGLVASAAPDVLVPEAERVCLVTLVHMPLGINPADHRPEPDRQSVAGGERDVLRASAAVIATSPWTRRALVERYRLADSTVQVAEPGVDPAAPARGTGSGGQLLCVGAVAPHKGQDLLVAALGRLADLTWSCACVGAIDRDPAFVRSLIDRASADGVAERIRFVGPLTGTELDAAYAGADVMVLASRTETYGMVVTEALARALPVIATGVGGLPDALGRAPDGRRPGILVPRGDVDRLAAELRRWLSDAELRGRLRGAAAERRTELRDWTVTAARVSRVLCEVAA